MGGDVSPSVLRHTLDSCCRELDERLRQGESIGAETYLARHPLLASDTEAAVELICQEFLTREELGHQPAPEEFLKRYAPWQERLGRQLLIHTILSDQWAAGGDREDSTGEQPSGFGLLPPRKGSYQTIREVASGTNVIYEAIQSGTGRRVALKCIGEGDKATTSQARGQLLEEARTASRLRHPNIVQVFDVGVQDDVPFLAMEFIEGQSLARWLKEGCPTTACAVRIIEVLARALDHAHSQEVIHRDLSPANIMLTTDLVPIITDFGLALHSGQAPRRRRLGVIVGTPGYMAPEQVGAASAVTAAADIHALGAILYELLVGSPPYPTELSLEALRRLSEGSVTPPRQIRREIPAALEAICLKCLERDPSQRYQTAGAMANDLSRFQRGESSVASSVARGLLRRRVPEKVILLLGAVGMGGVLWLLRDLRAELAQAQAQARLAGEPGVSRRLDEAESQIQGAREREGRLRAILDLRRAREAIRSRDTLLATDLLERLRPRPNEPDFRVFEWYALFRRLETPVAVLPDIHGASVFTVAVSPNGRQFVTGDIHGALVVWDAQTLQPRRVVPAHEAIVAFLRYTPDSRRLLSACGDPRGRRRLKLWDTETMEPLGEPVTLEADVRDMTVSADGRVVVVREHAPVDGCRLFGITPSGLLALRGPEEARLLAVGPVGRRLAAVSRDGTLSIYPLGDSPSTVAPSWSLEIEGHVEAIAWRPDGKGLVLATDRPNLLGIRLGEGVVWTAPREVGRNIRQIRFCKSSLELVATDARGLAVFDADTGALRRDCLPRSGAALLWSAVSPDGRLALTHDASQEVLRWDLESGQPSTVTDLQEIGDRAAAFFGDGRRAVIGARDGRPRIWRSIETPPQQAAHTKEAWCVAFAPFGTQVASGGDDNVVRIWNVEGDRLQPSHVLEGHAATVSSLAYTPDGKRLVSGDLNGGLILWDLDSFARIATLNPPRPGVQIRCLRIAPDGRSLATGWSDGALRIWDLASQTIRSVLNGHANKVHAVSYSAEGRWLASVSDDMTVRLWDVQGGKQPVLSWWRSLPAPGTGVAFSPDGAALAVGLQNGEIEVRETSDGALRFSAQGHGGDVRSLLFTPDGETLISGALDGDVQGWDPVLGLERVLLRRHKAGVHELALSPDGTRLVSCDHGGNLWLISAPRDSAATAASTVGEVLPRP